MSCLGLYTISKTIPKTEPFHKVSLVIWAKIVWKIKTIVRIMDFQIAMISFERSSQVYYYLPDFLNLFQKGRTHKSITNTTKLFTLDPFKKDLIKLALMILIGRLPSWQELPSWQDSDWLKSPIYFKTSFHSLVLKLSETYFDNSVYWINTEMVFILF